MLQITFFLALGMPKSNHKLSIKEWSEDDQPREKLIQHGSRHLSNAELLTILVRTGTPDQSALDICKTIRSDLSDDLTKLEKLSVDQLMSYNGVGAAKAVAICAALELGRRVQKMPSNRRSKITCSYDVFELMRASLTPLNHEEFWVLYLNRANKVLFKERHSQGDMIGKVVDTRLLLKTALEKGALNLMLVHNHPSGQKSPSQSDIDLTKKIQLAANQLDMNVLDHIIVAQNDYFSFADQGLM